MNEIAQQRCFLHGDREAVARCPSCQRHFCRECITEHDDQVLCAACLRCRLSAQAAPRARFHALGVATKSALGFLVLWLLFYELGILLLKLPSSFHEGSLWSWRLGASHDE